jgi:hypothetical protein
MVILRTIPKHENRSIFIGLPAAGVLNGTCSYLIPRKPLSISMRCYSVCTRGCQAMGLHTGDKLTTWDALTYAAPYCPT